MSLIAKRESTIRRLAGMKVPKLRSALLLLFQVKISPPLRPPPSKMVSSFITASAGPRVLPPDVIALVIDCLEKLSESESFEKSAALIGVRTPSSTSAPIKSVVNLRTIRFTAHPCLMRTVEATPNSEVTSTGLSNELRIHYLISAATSTPGGKITASIA